MAEEALKLGPDVIFRINWVREPMRSLSIMDKIVFELYFEDISLISSLQIGCLEVDSLLLKLRHLRSV